MQTFRFEASGFEKEESIHPFGHTKIFGKGKEISCEGVSMAPSAEILRKVLTHKLNFLFPWIVIWKV